MKVKEMKVNQMQILQKYLDEVNKKFSDIKDELYLFDYVLELNDILKLKSVEGNVDKYKKFLDKIVLFLLKFIFKKIL